MNGADFDLLLGILALQNGFIDQPALIAAFHVWSREQRRTLAAILEDRGDLSAARRALLLALAEEHVRGHGGDPGQSLAALSSDAGIRSALREIDDEALQASLGRVGVDRPPNDNPLDLPLSDDSGDASTVSYEYEPHGSHGRFRVLRPYAKGGLGAVAVALDSELHREVALKQIQPAYADHPESRARFMLEAEITGGLEHPGIVPVYSLGHDPNGRPFYAMRFIQGETLKQAADRFHQADSPDRDPGARTLEFQKVLRRFLDVCNAIAYAHSRGVLHRDIKPVNVMVGPFGETLVVDWGLAKVVGTESEAEHGSAATLRPPSASGSQMTHAGAAMGTPQYMSPEQASGDLDRLGPSSDVYSLGATLYYLLTGRTPFRPDKVDEVIARVRRGEFLPPQQANPLVPPALAAVCLKAMAMRPEDRYATPRELGDEIERWLADEPVLAYPEPWPLRARRWTRRHRAMVTATSAAVVVGAVGLAVTAGLLGVKNREIEGKNLALIDSNQQLDLQRKRAEAGERQAVDAIKKFRDAIANNTELKEREEFKELRKTLLREPLAFFHSLRNRLVASGDTRPETLIRLAEAAEELGSLSREIGDLNDAIRAFEESLAVYRRLVRDQPDETNLLFGLAGSQSSLGVVRNEIGEFRGARESFQEAESLLGALVHDHSEDLRFLLALARARNCLGIIERQEGQLGEAIVHYERAGADFESVIARDSKDANARYFLAVNRITFAELLHTTGRLAEALTVVGEARSILEGLARDRPGDEPTRSMLAESLEVIGEIELKSGRSDQAIAAYQESARIVETLAREHPSNISYQAKVAGVAIDLGKLLGEVGRPKDAVESYGRALELSEQLARERPDDVDARRRLGLLHYNLALAHKAAYQDGDALASWGRAREIQQEIARAHPNVSQFRIDLASTLINLGTAEFLAGRSADARSALEQARALYEELTTANPDVTGHWIGLAKCHGALALLLGNGEDALAANARALEINRRLATAHPEETQTLRDLAAVLGNRGLMLGRLGRQAEALKVFGETIEVLDRLVAAGPGITEYRSMLGQCLASRAELLVIGGRPAEALADFRKAKEVYAILARDHPEVIEHQYGLTASLGNLAAAEMFLGHTDEALESTREALGAFQRLAQAHPGVAHFRLNVALSHENIGGLLIRKGKPAEAIPPLEQARGVLESLPATHGHRRQLAQVHSHLGLAHAMAGHSGDARSAYQDAIQLLDRLAKDQPSDPEVQALRARCNSDLADLEIIAHRPDQARAPLQAARAILEKLVQERPEVLSHRADLALAKVRTASMLRASGEAAEALRCLEDAEGLLEPLVQTAPNEASYLAMFAHALDMMGQIELEAHRASQAFDRFTRALDQERQAIALQPGNPDYEHKLIDLLGDLALAAQALGREDVVKVAHREQAEMRDRTFPVDPFVRETP